MTTIPLPHAETLEGFRESLDPDTVRGWLSESMAEGFELVAAAPHYLRYKGLDGGLVAWSVESRGPDGARVRSHATLRSAVAPRLSGEVERLRYRDGEVYFGLRSYHRVADDVVLLAFPIDRSLTGLRHLLRGSRMRQFIADHLADFVPDGTRFSKGQSSVETVRYKPERRAVLRWQLGFVDDDRVLQEKRAVYMRAHADQSGARAVLAARAAAGAGISVPETLVSLDGSLVVESELRGAPAPLDENAETLGATLARLHTPCSSHELPLHSGLDELDAALRAESDLARLDPELGARAHAMLDGLARWVPVCEKPSLLHGDLHREQFLVDDGSIGLVDFDRARVGDPAYDFASLLAHEQLATNARADEVVDLVLSGYGRGIDSSALAWYSACALVRAALLPFRSMSPTWPQEAVRLLDLAASHCQGIGAA